MGRADASHVEPHAWRYVRLMIELAIPTLISITGFAGSGKSELSSRLAQACRIPRLGVDRIRDAIVQSGGYDAGAGNPTWVTKDVIFALSHAFLAHGVSVVIDMHMWESRDWDRLQGVIDASQSIAAHKFILTCPYDICVERVAERKRKNPDHALGRDNIGKHQHKWEAFQGLSIPDAIMVDANRAIDEVFEDIVNHITSASTATNDPAAGGSI